jgi:hypothetical protein
MCDTTQSHPWQDSFTLAPWLVYIYIYIYDIGHLAVWYRLRLFACYRCTVCCSVLQCVAVCCRVLQCAAVCCTVLQCVAVCCSVLQCLAVSCSMSQCLACTVCCCVLQCVAVCCSVSQCVTVRCSDVDGLFLRVIDAKCMYIIFMLLERPDKCMRHDSYIYDIDHLAVWYRLPLFASYRCMCVAVCCSGLQCVAVRCSVSQCVAVCCSMSHWVAVCCSVCVSKTHRAGVLQCVAVCCSVLQCVAVCCSVLQ